MKIIEHERDRLMIRSAVARWLLLLIGIFAMTVGSFFALIGVVIQQSDRVGLMPFSMGIMAIACAPFFAIKLSKVSTFTFDKSRGCILWEQYNSLGLSNSQSVEFPAHLIVGVEIVVSIGEGTGYYPQLILESVYWRIPLNTDGHYENAINLAKTISQFLNIDLFLDESKAPKPNWYQKTLKHAESGQPDWQYLVNEVERLQYQIDSHPQDAEAYQDLGISLYRSNLLNQTDAAKYLQQAEELFELQQEKDRADIARVIRSLISWGY